MSGIAVAPLWLPDVQQAVFKQLLMAMGYAGEPHWLPEGIDPDKSAIAILAALVDESTSYANPHGIVSPADSAFLAAPEVEPPDADFVVADVSREPDITVRNGTIYRPEHSATILLRCPTEESGSLRWQLKGPGIPGLLTLTGEAPLQRWLEWRNSWVAYPQGIDLILCRGRCVIALPRTTVIMPEPRSD